MEISGDSILRYDRLRAYAQDSATLEALSTYTENAFTVPKVAESTSYPLPDEPQVKTWIRYCDTARELGVFETLKQYLIQFRFPIQSGISQTNAYKAATLKGKYPDDAVEASGLVLEEPQSIELLIYQSPAGKIPVIIAPNRKDFRSIAQALIARNEPKKIPDSMGAAMIRGLNNWDRIRRIKGDWLVENPYGNWSLYFQTYILPNKALYQDNLILLGKNPYSGVAASALDLQQNDWLRHSLAIRLEHECAHFFTLRYFGCMANHMHDELIADYMGITKALGCFRADWFMHFIGLEDYPNYRPGGRLENYLGMLGSSPVAFNALVHLMKAAAIQVEIFDHLLGPSNTDLDRTYRLLALAGLDLTEIASFDGARQLTAHYERQKVIKVI